MKTVQREKRVMLVKPHDSNAGAVTSGWVDMSQYQHLTIHILCGVIGGDFAITLDQAKDNAAGSTKTLGFTTIYQADNSDATVTNRDKFVAVAVADDSHLVVASTDDEFHLIIEIDSASLDRANDFTHVSLALADPGAESFVAAVGECKMGPAGKVGDNDLMPSALG